jgi:hypothetical protein
LTTIGLHDGVMNITIGPSPKSHSIGVEVSHVDNQMQ